MKALDFCKEVVDRRATPKYVKRQMQEWMKICEGNDEKYMISEKKVEQLESILKILIMPKA